MESRPGASASHASRRLSAANAASATNLVPINSKRNRSLATDAPNSSSNHHASNGAAGKGKKEGAKTASVPRRPPDPVKVDENGHAEILQGREVIDSDELYGEQEKMLADFLKLHPMLSVCVDCTQHTTQPRIFSMTLCVLCLQLESTSHRTLQLVADLVDQTTIPTTELEVVPKSHDDRFLRCVSLPGRQPFVKPFSKDGFVCLCVQGPRIEHRRAAVLPQ